LPLFLLICVSLAIGCEERRSKVSESVDEMMGKQVDLSLEKMDCVQSVVDSGNSHPCNENYKLVVYMDSTVCSPCVISSLYEWNGIMKEMENVDFIFIVSPQPDQREASYLSVSSCGLLNVVYMDAGNLFHKNNSFLPKEEEFHTFLINNDNEIVIVGSPLKNPKIKNLMEQYILENASCLPNEDTEDSVSCYRISRRKI